MPERKQHVPTMTSVVYVVDDDIAMRESLVDFFRSMNIEAVAFERAADFLERADPARPGCILLDVRLPGVSGLDFQAQLERMGSRLPIIFMTGFGDIPMSVRAMKAGAVDFLTKPFRDQDILDAVTAALKRNAADRKEAAATEAVVTLVQSLTPKGAGGHGRCCQRIDEQADRIRPRHQRDYGEASSGQRHAQDAGKIASRPGPPRGDRPDGNVLNLHSCMMLM